MADRWGCRGCPCLYTKYIKIWNSTCVTLIPFIDVLFATPNMWFKYIAWIYIYILKLLHRMLSSLQTLPQPVFSWVWSLEDSGLISKLREAWCCKGYACKTGREKDTSEELHQIHNQSQSYFLYFNDAGMYLSFDLKNPEKRTLTSLPNFNCIVRSVGHPTVGVAKGHNFESLGTTGAYKSFMFLRIHFFIL